MDATNGSKGATLTGGRFALQALRKYTAPGVQMHAAMVGDSSRCPQAEGREQPRERG
jgi:hypothetical protein